MRLIIGICFGAALVGCVSTVRSGDDEFSWYVKFCREIAMPSDGEKDPDGPCSKVDWMVGNPGTTHEFNTEYRIVYADRDYLSFYAKECSYCGGAHGATVIRVGTISKTTGRILKITDFVADDKRAALKAALHDGAVKVLGGKERLQSEVEIIENFYLAKDGLHFVYNEYEIACYAAGTVEVVIDPKALRLK